VNPWLASLAVTLAAYVAFLGGLALAGRRTDAAALARMGPDLVVLTRRLAADRRIRRRVRLILAALVLYLVNPVDLVPDFLPVVGLFDDVLLVVLVLRAVTRVAGPGIVGEHWPGPQRGLELLLIATRGRG